MNPEGTLKRCTKQFTNLFLKPYVVDNTAIDNLSEVHYKLTMRSTHDEVTLAIKQLNTSKAHGLDGISVLFEKTFQRSSAKSCTT